jgi:hypothetical protein
MTFKKYHYYGIKTKQHETNGHVQRTGRYKINTKFHSEKQKRRENLEDLGVDGMIILK